MCFHLEDFCQTLKGSCFKEENQKAKVENKSSVVSSQLSVSSPPTPHTQHPLETLNLELWTFTSLELGIWNFLTYVPIAMAVTKSQQFSDSLPLPLPELVGRVAILGGNATEKTSCLVGLALRQIHQHGTVLCLDARHHKQTEVYFRLLLRQPQSYLLLPGSREVSSAAAQAALSTVSRSLATTPPLPPLLLCDSIRETPDWERTVIFLLNAGATVVEMLPDATALVFGRYDTVILLREETAAAEELSRAVGRKVSPTELQQMRAGEGQLIHLAQVYRVRLPKMEKA